MVTEVKPNHEKDFEKELDDRAMKVFLKSLDILGGPRKLFEYRNLTWLPSLVEASYVVVLFEDYMKSSKEIASMLGLSSATVSNILRAKEEDVVNKILNSVPGDKGEKPHHVAGSLAKMAYKKLREEEQK